MNTKNSQTLQNKLDEKYISEIHLKKDNKNNAVFLIGLDTEFASKGNGGTRFLDYQNIDSALDDLIKLVNAMSKKTVIIGKKHNAGFAGGKGIIISKQSNKTKAMLHAYGEFVDSLNGKFMTGTDVGINLEDIEIIHERTDFVDGLKSNIGDTAVPTAIGVVDGMKSVMAAINGTRSLNGLRIAVQGTGAVGVNLIELLEKEDAEIIATDINEERLLKIREEFDIETVKPDKIHKIDCDIFSPNAIGGIINEKSVQSLKCKAIIGGANNQLFDEKGLETLEKRRIVYAPDFVINIGGVFQSMCESRNKTKSFIYNTTKKIVAKRMQQLKNENSIYRLNETAEKLVQKERRNAYDN